MRLLQVLAAAGQVECEALQWTKCQKFALIVFGFIGTLYSNVTSLKVCVHLGNTARSLVTTVYLQALASLHRLRALLARKLSTGTCDPAKESPMWPHVWVVH